MTKEIAKWSDEAMFEAAPIDSERGPEVFLLGANPDPLGSIAHAALAYVGDFRESLAMITDDERRHYLAEIQKTALAMPLEPVNFEFMFRGVTRGFTHQLVRQRTASYSQESTRFAVKSGVPVGLPPSLQGTNPRAWHENWKEGFNAAIDMRLGGKDEQLARQAAPKYAEEYAYKHTSQRNRWRYKWDQMMKGVAEGYNELVNDGMPAEDARGSLPTNLLTQINYNTSLRGLQDHAGLRLCTQAQFEWKQVWGGIIKAIKDYGKAQTYWVQIDQKNLMASGTRTRNGHIEQELSSAWQFEALANIFRPICYKTGKCEFKADFDRKCSIRNRVDEFAANGVSSENWHIDNYTIPVKADPVFFSADSMMPNRMTTKSFDAINPAEWLFDPTAAR